MKQQLLLTILWGGLIAGAMDITAASTNSMLSGGNPVRVFQSVAGGLLGRETFQGGWKTAALGLVIHFLIATVWTAVYATASLKLSPLTQYAVPCGVCFGIVVYLFMYAVVLPLSAYHSKFFNQTTTAIIIGLLIHVFCVGLPIALVTRWQMTGKWNDYHLLDMTTEATLFPPSVSNAASTPRVNAVDLLRGLVMVIMLLDHTREFSHREFLNFDPLDFEKTNTILFFTRWVTNFCAPVFVFLAGTGAYLQTLRGKSKPELARFLITRGLWLIVLELTVIRVLVWFNLDFRFAFMLQVIWVIGVGMILLAGLIYLPLRVVAIGSVAMIALHNLLDGIRVQGFPAPGKPLPGGWDAIWMILHQQGMVFFTPNVYGLLLYPLIPWVAVLSAGYCFGVIYEWEPQRRKRFLVRLGAGLLLGFVVLRALNLYGDPSRWSQQKNVWFTVLSFLNVSKYPPSLLFLLLTLGAAMLALPWFEQPNGFLARIMITFGRVPLLFYLGQWLTAHGLPVVVGYLVGQPIGWLFVTALEQPRPNPGNLGYSLWVVYVFWFVGLLLLYPVCRWFAEVKRRRRDWWLSYL